MGSSFSIVNDTDKPIWVSDGVCHAALWGSVAGVLAVATAGAAAGAYAAGAATAAAATTAGAAEGWVIVGTMEGIVMVPVVAGIALPASTVAGLTAAGWTAVGSVSGLLSFTAGTVAGLSAEHEQNVLSAKNKLEKKLKSYTRIEPGCKHTVTGSLSLVWTAYVIYDDGRLVKRDCWTGATDGSENLYPVTEYF